MTVQEPRRGRSPGAILAGLIFILLLCAGVIVWDQTRPITTDGSSPGGTINAPSPDRLPPPASPSENDGFGDLK